MLRVYVTINSRGLICCNNRTIETFNLMEIRERESVSVIARRGFCYNITEYKKKLILKWKNHRNFKRVFDVGWRWKKNSIEIMTQVALISEFFHKISKCWFFFASLIKINPEDLFKKSLNIFLLLPSFLMQTRKKSSARGRSLWGVFWFSTSGNIWG